MRDAVASSMPRMPATFFRSDAFSKSWPPSRFVVLLNSREPIALHWPVIELAPVPGRPMLPVINARLMMACAVRVPSWLWLTPIVHQNETRLPSWICRRIRWMRRRVEAGFGARRSGVKSATKLGKRPRSRRCGLDVTGGRSSPRDQQMAPGHRSNARSDFGLIGQVQRGGHRGFGLARVDHDNLRACADCADALPKDRMGDAQIGPTRHDNIRFLKIFVGKRRRVEAKGLLVSGRRRWPCTAACCRRHAACPCRIWPGAEQRHFFGGNLAGAEKGNRVRPVFLLDGLDPVAKHPQGRIPIDRLPLPGRFSRSKRRRGAVVGLQDSQRLPALGTSHAKIHGIVRLRTEVHRLAFAEMDFQAATRRTEAADHRRDGIRGLLRGDFSQTETARIEQQIASQMTVAGMEQVFEAAEGSRSLLPVRWDYFLCPLVS